MNAPWILLIAHVSLAVEYVLLPVALPTFLSYRGRRVLHCPETGKEADVDIDTRRAALGSMFGRTTLQVRDCSLWPDKKSCPPGCLNTLTASTGMFHKTHA